MPPPLVVNFATSPWINPQTPNSNPNVCNYCFSNHSVVNVICSRARDDFIMDHKPSLEDEWTDRIFNAFSRKQKLAKANNENFVEVTDLVVMTKDQEERAIVIESEKQRARELCSEIFSGSMSVIRSCDIPFQGWSSSDIVLLILEEVINKDTNRVKRAIRDAISRWHPDKFKQILGHKIAKPEF